MRELDNAKQNCDHVFEGTLMIGDSESQCANCGKFLTKDQLIMICKKSILILEDKIKERDGIKNESL